MAEKVITGSQFTLRIDEPIIPGKHLRCVGKTLSQFEIQIERKI
jgi:hypothetical protein